MSILTLEEVSYQYPLEVEPVIKQISLDFDKGKVYGLVGSNDAGKTTLCNIIRGFIPSVYKGILTGEVRWKGKALGSYDDGEIASMIGYSFQNPFTQISGVKETVYEEIAYGMENLGIPRDNMIKRVNELLELFHLEELREKNPFELSGGQKQRVALAAVIALDPEFIILDEPTSQLDPQSTEDVFDIIRILKNQGKTILLVEHKIDLLAEYCDQIIIMDDGEIKMTGDTQHILTNKKVNQYGVQLPKIADFFIEAVREGYLDQIDSNDIPLTIGQAQNFLSEER